MKIQGNGTLYAGCEAAKMQGKEWNLESSDSKWEKEKKVDVSSRD